MFEERVRHSSTRSFPMMRPFLRELFTKGTHASPLGPAGDSLNAASDHRQESMVASRLFRTAGACLTICPFVMCGGERDGRVLSRVSVRSLSSR